jgi:hypothetical protein
LISTNQEASSEVTDENVNTRYKEHGRKGSKSDGWLKIGS